ncbi:transcription antitermination factor NusB [Flavobacteriaceae bacterium]|nr:transcription antitermination factor NusB [Flavobacteriaceae bacterium]MDC1492964.1 transcription antitermination factor NusB [Flavobacteriaceae bacterium]
MQLIYALKICDFNYDGDTNKQLFKSLEDIYDLYLILISLIIEVQIKAESHLKISQNKHLATSDDINPSKKFINNRIVLNLRSNKLIQGELKKRKLDIWKLDNEYVDVIFNDLIKSDLYSDYLSSSLDDFNSDKVFCISFFKKVVVTNEKLYNYLEDKNITWSDDFPVVNTSIVKMLNKSNSDSAASYFIPTLFKDVDDKKFATDLLKLTTENYKSYNEEISKKTSNWDPDRIANIDYVILNLAISEFLNFPTIPVKVTINEYIELSKEYSTPKSNVFVNGILDAIVKDYSKRSLIIKEGRGLVE